LTSTVSFTGLAEGLDLAPLERALFGNSDGFGPARRIQRTTPDPPFTGFVAQTGVVMDLPSVLAVAAGINQEAVRIVDAVASQIDQGTIPLWKRFISRWGPHGDGTAEQNWDARHALTC
jgi:hypothetical protein